MNTRITRRIEALEKTRLLETGFLLIIRRLVTPGQATGETVRAEVWGHTLHREEAETEDAFIQRLRIFAREAAPVGSHAARAVLSDGSA